MVSLLGLTVLITVILCGTYTSAQQKDYKRVCYYTNWSQYRTGLGKFTPQNVDPFLCTHVVFAFAKTSGNRIEAAEWNDESTEWSRGTYAKINDLKKKNPKLKTLLAIGGWTEGNAPISTMASTNESRDEFVSTTIQYLRTRGFDGLDLDWEYPGSRGGPPEDKENLIHLLKKLRSEFERESRETGREALLLAIAVPVGEERISSGYNIREVDRYVDFINLMAYDFHGAWEAQTGHHSPLFRAKAERWYAGQLNVQWAAAFWRRNGASKDKLVIGVAMYGRGYKLQYPSINGIGAQALVGSNGNSMGPFTKSKGLLAYYEICDRLNGNGVEVWDEERYVPYMFDGSDWVGYENTRSVIKKTKWMMDHRYGGIMIWALDQDDFTGHFCKAGKYPLLSAINKTLKEYTPSTDPATKQLDAQQAAEEYEGTTKRIVDSTSFSLTGLTLKHRQGQNSVTDATTLASSSTTSQAATTTTTSTVATTVLVTTSASSTTESTTATTATTNLPSTTSATAVLSSTSSEVPLSKTTLESTTITSSNMTPESTTDVTTETNHRNNLIVEETTSQIELPIDNTTANLQLQNTSINESKNIPQEDNATNTTENTTENTTLSILSSTANIDSKREGDSIAADVLMRSSARVMSIVAPSEVYSATDIVHRGRTLLQVDLNRNDPASATTDGQSSGFTSVLNSLFSVLSEFGGFVGSNRQSSGRRANNGDTAGQRNAEPQRQRNADPPRSRSNVDSQRQRSVDLQRQRNEAAQPVREVPVQRNDLEFQRARNAVSRARNVDASRQDNNIDPTRQRMLGRTSRISDPVQTVQRNSDPAVRRNSESFRRRTNEASRQRNELLRRNNDLLRQRNGNTDILRQRGENADLLRQRNGNNNMLIQQNGDMTQQQRNTLRNSDIIQQRNTAAQNLRNVEPRRQRVIETPRRMRQRIPNQTPNRRAPQLGGMNTVSPQFDPFQNVEMATIPQNLGPPSSQRGDSNSLPSVDFLETLVQGSSQRNIDPSRMNGRGRDGNRIVNRNPNQISPGVPDLSTLTDMFLAQDPQNQLLQQETVQTSITEAMLSPNFINRANGFGRLQRMMTPDPIQPPNVQNNRNISSNRQASLMRETLFNEIRNRQPSLNTNSIDTIDLAFLESQVEEGFARDRAQQIEQSMLRPGMLANEAQPNVRNGMLPSAGFQGIVGQFPPQQTILSRNLMIPRPNQFQQTSMHVPDTNRNTSMAVIPFNNLDRTLQQIVATGPGFRIRNQTASTISRNSVLEQGLFRQNNQQLTQTGNSLNSNILSQGPQKENSRNLLFTSKPGLPGPLQLARLQDSTRSTRNMLGPLGPIQGNRNLPAIQNSFMSSIGRMPRVGTPLLQTANTNNQISPNSLLSPLNQITARVSTVGSPGSPHRTPPPFSSNAIQTPDEVIQGTNTIGPSSAFSQRTNSTINIDSSMLKSEPVIPKSEILWKWDV